MTRKNISSTDNNDSDMTRKNTDNAIYKKIKIQGGKGRISYDQTSTRSGYIHFGYHQDQRRHRHRLHKTTTLNNKIIVAATVTVTIDFQMYNFVT
jgi:hypothetical protein